MGIDAEFFIASAEAAAEAFAGWNDRFEWREERVKRNPFSGEEMTIAPGWHAEDDEGMRGEEMEFVRGCPNLWARFYGPVAADVLNQCLLDAEIPLRPWRSQAASTLWLLPDELVQELVDADDEDLEDAAEELREAVPYAPSLADSVDALRSLREFVAQRGESDEVWFVCWG